MVEDFDEVVEHYHLAIGEFMKGNPEPAKTMFSHQDDVTLANPRGVLARGWKPGVAEHKYYAAGVGDFKEVTVKGPSETLGLVKVEHAG